MERIVTVDELMGLAGGATPDGHARAAVFDADHTLWHGDIGDLAFAASAHARLLSDAMFTGPLTTWARAVDLVLPSDKVAALALIAQDAASGALAERVRTRGLDDHGWRLSLYEMQAWIFADQPRAALTALGEQLLNGGLARKIYPEMTRLIRGLRDRGVDVWIASASHGALVQAGAPHVGLAVDHALGMEPADAAPTMRLSTYGPGKRDAAIARLGAPPWFAFGDSVLFTDRALLESAHSPVAVAAKSAHRDAARAHARMLLLDPAR